jgi:hypothetical protein
LIVKAIGGIPKDFSAAQKKKAVSHIGSNASRFRVVIEEFFKGPYRYTQLIAGALEEAVKRHPELLLPYLKRFLVQLDQKGNYPAMTRNILRMLQHIDIPASFQARAVNSALRIMQDPAELVAAKVFAMTVMANIATRQPELKNEVRSVIESQYPYSTPAFRSRARRVLKALER